MPTSVRHSDRRQKAIADFEYELMTIQIATPKEHVSWWTSAVIQASGCYSQCHCRASTKYYSTCSVDDEAQAVFFRRRSDGDGRGWNRRSNPLTTVSHILPSSPIVEVASLAYLGRQWLLGNNWRSSNASIPALLTTVSPLRASERFNFASVEQLLPWSAEQTIIVSATDPYSVRSLNDQKYWSCCRQSSSETVRLHVEDVSPSKRSTVTSTLVWIISAKC